VFAQIGKKTECLLRFSTVAGERGAADAERDVRGFALKFYTDEGNWDLVGNNTPVFFVRDPLKFPDFIHTQKRHPKQTCAATPRCGLLVAFSRIIASGDHSHVRPRPAPQLAPPQWLWSHTYSFINAENERFWVKFHFKPNKAFSA